MNRVIGAGACFAWYVAGALSGIGILSLLERFGIANLVTMIPGA